MLKRTLILSIGLLPFLFAGCGGTTDDTEDTTVAPPGDDDDDTADTASTSGYLDVANISFSGFFAYDENAGAIVDYTVDGSAAPSVFIITLGTASYAGDPNDVNNYCSVFIDLAGYTEEDFAKADGYLFGFHVPQGAVAGDSDCLDKGFDPGWFYDYPPLESMGGLASEWGIGVAIGGEVSSDVADYLSTAYTAEEIADQFIGGEFVDTAGLDGGTNLYFRAYAVDANFDVDSTSDPVDPFSISDGAGNLASGVYSFSMTIYWSFA